MDAVPLGLAPGPELAGWADPVVFMGHAAVTTASEHLFAETLARGGVGQAGVVATPFRAFIDDWSLEARDNGADAGISRLFVSASGAQFRYQLTLSADMPPVLEATKDTAQVGGRAGVLLFQPALLHGRGRTHFARRADKGFRAAPGWIANGAVSRSRRSKGLGLVLAASVFRRKADAVSLRGVSGRDFIGGNWIDADGATRQLAPEDVSIEPLATTTLASTTLPTRWRVTVKSRAVEHRDDPAQSRELDGKRALPIGKGRFVSRDARRPGLSRNDRI